MSKRPGSSLEGLVPSKRKFKLVGFLYVFVFFSVGKSTVLKTFEGWALSIWDGCQHLWELGKHKKVFANVSSNDKRPRLGLDQVEGIMKTQLAQVTWLWIVLKLLPCSDCSRICSTSQCFFSNFCWPICFLLDPWKALTWTPQVPLQKEKLENIFELVKTLLP